MSKVIVIRKLTSETIEGFRARAKRNGRTMEGEARVLIEAAVYGEQRLLTYAEWQAEHDAGAALPQAAE